MRGKQSLWNTIGFSPIAMLTLLCVVAGTILFMYSFLPYVCQKIRQKKSRLYHENTIIVVPKFMHRIRSNAKSLILLILLTAGTLAVFARRFFLCGIHTNLSGALSPLPLNTE